MDVDSLERVQRRAAMFAKSECEPDRLRPILVLIVHNHQHIHAKNTTYTNSSNSTDMYAALRAPGI